MPAFPEIRKALRRAFLDAPTLTGSSLRQSRSLAGSFSSDSEVNAYKGIAFYIADGISLHEEEIKAIISRISYHQFDVRFAPYRFTVIPLNYKANKAFQKEAVLRYSNNVRVPAVWELFADLSGQHFSDNAFFDGFYPAGNTAQEWLHIFLVPATLFSMTEAGRTAFTRTQYQKHSIAFVSGEQAEYAILQGKELYKALVEVPS